LEHREILKQNGGLIKKMARQRELLSLVDIADETGISYATLRNYALKYGDEIPSEGSGRNTRYPRPAVKVFQRLRKESKPGRKPASAALPQAAPAPMPVPAPVRQEPTLLSRFAAPAPATVAAMSAAPAVADNSGLEKELASIRCYLASIADSLKRLVTTAETSAAPAAAPAPAETPAPAVVAAAPAVAKEQIGAAVPLPELRDGSSGSEKPGQRRLQSMPKVWGQRGRRPE
jgi:hypothetical protein